MTTRTYGYTVYHDDPGEAAINAASEHGYRTRRDATAAAKAAMDDYWNGGATVESEDFTPGVFGESPDSYEFVETIAYIPPAVLA